MDKKLSAHLKSLLLPTMRSEFKNLAEVARREGLSYEEYLLDLAEVELEQRNSNRFKRWMKESGLPPTKNLLCFDTKRLPREVLAQFKILLEGGFIDAKENVLLFGTPGSGKTHLMCALGQEMIRNGFKCCFRTCGAILQDLLVAKKELRLNKAIKKLTSYNLLLIDELGYVRQEREEMEVLFSLLANCYEKTSVVITSNLPFSKWDGVFNDAMMAAAAIDRLVHHGVILELNIPSYRVENSKKKKGK
jgi:DNA replication protein DnaC